MPGTQFLPFAAEHLDVAARLLGARHRRHREAEPLLAEVNDFRGQIEGELEREGAMGSVALRNGDVAAYMVASPKRYTNTGLTWMVVDFAGHAVDGDPELVRDLYAAAAERWVEAGHTRHCAYVPASEPALVDAWFRLCFGASGITAARETEPQQVDGAGLVIRDGKPEDLEDSARLDGLMADSMRPGPSFSGMEAISHEDIVEDWRDTWEEDEFKHFVAEREGRIAGHILLYRRPAGDLRIPDDSIDLAAASTESEARGTGVGRALTAHVIDWAHENGYRTMTTDWRMTNLLASRFWPRRGFRPTFLRMYRSIP